MYLARKFSRLSGYFTKGQQKQVWQFNQELLLRSVTSSTLNCVFCGFRVFNSEVCHGYPMLLKELGHTNVKVQWVDGLHGMEVIL